MGKKEPDKDETEQKTTGFLTKNRNKVILAVRARSLHRVRKGFWSTLIWNEMEEKGQQLHSIKHKDKNMCENGCLKKKEVRKGQRKEESEEGRKDQLERILSNKTSFNIFQNKPVTNV